MSVTSFRSLFLLCLLADVMAYAIEFLVRERWEPWHTLFKTRATTDDLLERILSAMHHDRRFTKVGSHDACACTGTVARYAQMHSVGSGTG